MVETKLPIGPQFGEYQYSPNELVVHIATGIKMWIGKVHDYLVECRLPNLDIKRFYITEIMPYEMFIEKRGEDKLADYTSLKIVKDYIMDKTSNKAYDKMNNDDIYLLGQ